MYERMLDKQVEPTREEMYNYCGETSKLFVLLNEWLTETYHTKQRIVFPYGKHYGWGIAHRVKEKMFCTLFPEKESFTVMLRLSHQQFESVYDKVDKDTPNDIVHKYPCGDGGWIHYRILCQKNYEDIKMLLMVKGAKNKLTK